MNQGLSSFENATIDLLVDGLNMNTTVLSLEGNSSASLVFQLSIPYGNHTLEIIVDGCEAILESSEDNNSILLQIQVEPSGENSFLHWALLLIFLAFILIIVLAISPGRKG
jgi:subtilase family serine protease